LKNLLRNLESVLELAAVVLALLVPISRVLPGLRALIKGSTTTLTPALRTLSQAEYDSIARGAQRIPVSREALTRAKNDLDLAQREAFGQIIIREPRR